MEIRIHLRLIQARYKGCTNARCISSRSYRHEEFKNVNPFWVQKAHKAVRAGQYLNPMLRSIVPSMEIRAHSRLILARYKGCTNARCILPRSYEHEEFKNVNLFSVQKAHKAVRACQYLRSRSFYCVFLFFLFLSVGGFLHQSSAQPHESAARPLQRAAGHIKGTRPRLPP